LISESDSLIGDRLVSRLDVTLEPKAAAGRRVEVIAGGGGRRRWSDDEKARAIEESLAPGVVVSEIARRHGLTPQQLFGWRREARRKAADEIEASPFVPAIVATADADLSRTEQFRTEPGSARPHNIELDIEGTSVWIWRGAETAMVRAIISTLKGRK
jgi:transposase